MFGWIQWDEILIPQKPLCSPSHLSIPLYKAPPWGHRKIRHERRIFFISDYPTASASPVTGLARPLPPTSAYVGTEPLINRTVGSRVEAVVGPVNIASKAG
jgi:hypothetical protein